MKTKAIAITGGIGSGKSEVAKILRDKGFWVVSCDKIAAELGNDPRILQKVRKLLGDESVHGGALNRKFIREKVFSDDILYRNYSEIFWEGVKQRLQQILHDISLRQTTAEGFVCSRTDVVFVEIPVISAFEFDWRAIWLVESDRQTRIARVSSRDGVSVQNVADIMSRQAADVSFTVKILNNGTIDELKIAVDSALAAL